VSPDSHCPPRLRGAGREPPGNSRAPTLNAVDAVACRARSGRLDVSSGWAKPPVLMRGSGARQSRGLVGRRGARLCPSYTSPVDRNPLRRLLCKLRAGTTMRATSAQIIGPGRSDRCAAARHRRGAPLWFALAASALACDRQTAISEDFRRSGRELCLPVSDTTNSFIALKPHSASRALVRSFGAYCRRLTGLPDIDPSRGAQTRRHHKLGLDAPSAAGYRMDRSGARAAATDPPAGPLQSSQ
jgi:hypothetical protein